LPVENMQTRRKLDPASLPDSSILKFLEVGSGRYSFDTTAASTTPPTKAA
jgi:hypothetical protein